QRLVMRDRASGARQRRGQCRKILDEESRVRLSRRGKILFDPEMNLQFAVLEPAAAAAGKFVRLFGLRNAKNRRIEISCVGLPAGGHGEQDMIQSTDAHRSNLVLGD